MKIRRILPALLTALLMMSVLFAGCRKETAQAGDSGTTVYGAENPQGTGGGGTAAQQGEGQQGTQSLEEAAGITLPAPEEVLYAEYIFRGIEERRYVTADAELTAALLEGTGAVEAGPTVNERADDYDEILLYVLTDGSEVTVRFNAGSLDTGEQVRETLEDGALRSALNFLTEEAENWAGEAQDTSRLKNLEDPLVLLYTGSYDREAAVALYLYAFRELPANYLTKKKARELGWENGSLERYAPGRSIGGDHFGNYEELLPDGDYRECDIGTLGRKSRGARRIIFTTDYSRIYYTDDHYKHFTLLYGEEEEGR